MLKDKIHTMEVHFAGRSVRIKLSSFLIQLSGGKAQLGMLWWHQANPIKQQHVAMGALTLLLASYRTGRHR